MDIIISGILGGLIGWLISSYFHKKASKEQQKIIKKLALDLKGRNKLEYFELLLQTSKWRKEFVGHDKIYIAEEDNTFQIHKGLSDEEFHERWTEMHPDQNTKRCPVYLKISETVIKELDFIVLDGGRKFVPMPEKSIENDEPKYSWNKNSLEMKVCKIVGRYYIYRNIHGVAKRSGITVVN